MGTTAGAHYEYNNGTHRHRVGYEKDGDDHIRSARGGPDAALAKKIRSLAVLRMCERNFRNFCWSKVGAKLEHGWSKVGPRRHGAGGNFAVGGGGRGQLCGRGRVEGGWNPSDRIFFATSANTIGEKSFLAHISAPRRALPRAVRPRGVHSTGTHAATRLSATCDIL